MKRFIALLVAMWIATSVAAAPDIGKITKHRGLVSIIRDGKTIITQQHTAVQMGDKIVSKNGAVTITFDDDTTVEVSESSSLEIDEFVYDGSNKTGKLAMRAVGGTVRYVSGKIAHNNPKSVNIKTPTATIAVRGTDFIMSVNEIGSSTVILMPTCDWVTSAVSGLTCGSGKIDVETPTGLVTLNRPYQATFVETAHSPPLSPVTVNLFNVALNNNLQLIPPQTSDGKAVTEASKKAAESLGMVVAEQQNFGVKHSTASGSMDPSNVHIVSLNKQANEAEITVTDTENPHLSAIWKDSSHTQQIGWQYHSLSENQRNYASIVLPLHTEITVSISQDMKQHSYKFSESSAAGAITITQVYR